MDVDLDQLNSQQLEKLYKKLNATAHDVYKMYREKLIEAGIRPYLRTWLDLTELPKEIKNYFLDHANINDFILENGYYNHYYKRSKHSFTTPCIFNAWSCKWMLKYKGDYISFRGNDEHHNLIPKHRLTITLDNIIDSFINLSDDTNNKKFMTELTEYVIYTAIKYKPSILKITEQNSLFSNKTSDHLKFLDEYHNDNILVERN